MNMPVARWGDKVTTVFLPRPPVGSGPGEPAAADEQ